MRDLLHTWARGWALSRGTAAPVETADGFRVRVGLPGHRVRHVLHTWDRDRLHALDADAGPGTWITVAGTDEDLRSALPPRWVVAGPGHLMTVRLTAVTGSVPPPYRLTLATDGPVSTARVLDPAGTVAAAARLARTGDAGIADRVRTAPEHRRRGLAAAAMRALQGAAREAGLTEGVLISTEEGFGLYAALGWTRRAPMAAAHVPED